MSRIVYSTISEDDKSSLLKAKKFFERDDNLWHAVYSDLRKRGKFKRMSAFHREKMTVKRIELLMQGE